MSRARAIWIFFLSLLQGGYMIFDGLHHLHRHAYFGSRLGPWARIVIAAGISPDSLAPVFIVAGVLWVAGAVALLSERRWAHFLLAGMAALTLLYLVFGTLLSLVLLVLLFTGRSPRRRLS